MISEFVEYVKQAWQNKPNVSSPLNADRLNHMEDGIENNSKKIKEIVPAVNELTEKMYTPEVIGKVVAIGSNDATFKLKRTTDPYGRYTAMLSVTSQNCDLIGVYIIGVNNTGEAITKIAGGANATIARSGDDVIVTFDSSNIYSSGLLIAPKSYV